MIRLAVRVRRDQAELVLAELLELAPGGVEEVDIGDGVVEYAVYGAPGELPTLPDLQAVAGGVQAGGDSRARGVDLINDVGDGDRSAQIDGRCAAAAVLDRDLAQGQARSAAQGGDQG